MQSVDRALSIIETLAEDDEGYRLSDLAVRTGLSTSTVHRLLATLEKRRFVQFDRHESKWHVGARAFTVGATFARRRNFSAQAMPYLRKLRDLTRETANLAVVDDEFIIVLTRAGKPRDHALADKSRRPRRDGGVRRRQGGARDLFRRRRQRHHPPPRHAAADRKIDRAAERPVQGTRKVRRQGYALDDEEARIGLRCIAAVVYNDCSEPLAAISVSGMTSRITDERLPTLGETVREVAAELTLALGGVMPAAKAG